MPEQIVEPTNNGIKTTEIAKKYPGPVGETHGSFGEAQQALKDSLKVGEGVNEAERARIESLKLGGSENVAKQAQKDSLKLGDSARVSEQQRLSGDLINRPKSPPKK